MTSLVVGVIGHVDHGKSALVRALTGKDTDSLPEEKERGISIALGFAHFRAGTGEEIDLVDMPGHERFVRTMISGATGIDAVLLVVAANEGVRPQTIEHVDIAGLLGLRRAVVAVSKTDLVTPEEARRVADEAASLLIRSGLEPLPPAFTSALREEGVAELREALATLSAGQQPRAADGLAFLPVDRAFTIPGHGPVVTGTLRGAEVASGDRLELLPSGRSVRVRSVHVHGERVTSAAPGQRVALNLRDVEIAELKRGMAVAASGSLAHSDWLTISIKAVEGAPQLKNGRRLRVLIGTDEFEARLRLMDRDVLEAGEAGFAQLHCARPVAVPAREPVILRFSSPSRTVAGGRVLEPETRRLRRSCPPVLDRLMALRDLPPVELIAAELEREGAAGVNLHQISRLCALAPAKVAELLGALPVVVMKTGRAVRQADMESLVARIPALLAARPEGLSHDGLLAALPGTGEPVLEEALSRLHARGAIARRGSQFQVPRPEEDRAHARDEAQLVASIAETLRQGGLSPPRPDEIVTDPRTRRAVDRLLREGTVLRAVDRAKGKEILFHEDAIEEARHLLEPLLADGSGLLVSEIAAALGISRKYCMPLLDHLDTIRFTRRIGDRRLRAVVPNSEQKT